MITKLIARLSDLAVLFVAFALTALVPTAAQAQTPPPNEGFDSAASPTVLTNVVHDHVSSWTYGTIAATAVVATLVLVAFGLWLRRSIRQTSVHRAPATA